MRELLLTQGNLSRKLRQLLVFLTLVLMPIGVWGQGVQYNIYINGTQLTENTIPEMSAQYGALFAPNISENSGTLTLTNATNISTIRSELDDLTIQLVGSSTISGNVNNQNAPSISGNGGTISFEGTGSLNFTGESSTPISGFSSVSFTNLGYYPSTKEIKSATTYPLWVGGMQVTSGNASGITGAGITGTVTFNSSNNTLTLDNAHVNGTVSTSLTELNVHLKGHSVFNVETNTNNNTYLFNGSGQSLTLNYSAESIGDVLEGIGTANSYKLKVSKNTTTENYDGTAEIWKNSNSVENEKDYCKLSKPYLYVGDTDIDKSNYNSFGDYFSFDAGKSSLTISGIANNNMAYDCLVKSFLANLTVNITDDIIYQLKTGTSTGKVFVYTGTDANSTLTLNIAEGKTLKTLWSTDTGSTDWINDGFTNTNISTNLSTMGSSDVYAEASQVSEEYSVLFSKSTPTSYGITVAGVEVTSANASNVLNDAYSSVSYDSGENTLTLKGVLLNDTDDDIVLSSAVTALIINLVGCNTIGDISVSSAALTFTTSSTLPGCLKLNNISGNSTLAYENNILSWDASNNIIKASDNNENLISSYVTGYTTQIDGDYFLHSSGPSLYSSYATLENNQYIKVSTSSSDPAYPTSAYLFPPTLDGKSQLTKLYFQFDWGTCTNKTVSVQAKGFTANPNNYNYLEDDGKTYSEVISLSSYGNGDIVEIPLTSTVTDSDVSGLVFTSSSSFSFVPITVGFLKTESPQNTENYDLWIGDTQVTSANISDYSGVSFNASTNTLSLENAEITSQLKYTGTADLVISLKGDNSISSTTTSSALSATSNSNPKISIIKVEGATDASLDLYVTNNASATAYEGFTIGTNFLGEGLYGLVPSTIATGSDRYVITTKAYGLMVGGDNVQYYSTDLPCYKDNILGDNLTNGGEAKATFNPTGNILTLNNASITANDPYNVISSNLNALTICVKGNNTLTCDIVPLYSHNINAPLTIVKDDSDTNEAQLILKSSSTSAIYGFSSLTYSDSFTPYSVNTDGGRGSETTISYDESAHELNLSKICFYAPSTSTTSYGLTVADIEVTSENASSITGTGITGTVTFTPASDTNGNILTLNGATITGAIWLDTGTEMLTIAINGTCNVINENGTYALYTNGDGFNFVKATGANSAKLTATCGNGYTPISLASSSLDDGLYWAPVSSNSIIITDNSSEMLPAPTIAFDANKDYVATDKIAVTRNSNDQISTEIFYTWGDAEIGAVYIHNADNPTLTNYSNNNKIAVQSATLRAWVGYNYNGDNYYVLSEAASQTFTVKKDIASCTVNLPESATYNGEAYEPVVDDGATATAPTQLTLGTDYTVSYQKTDGETVTNVNAMIDAGTYNITITGTGDYTGTKEVTGFQIGKANLADAVISKLIVGSQEYTATDTDIEIPYTGNAIQPSVVVKINNGLVTVDESDYSVSCTNNTNVSGPNESATLTITSTGKNFTSDTSKSLNFKIVPASVTITAIDQTVTYNGQAQDYSNATVDNDNATLSIAYYTKEEDRTKGSNALAEAPTNAGTYYVKVTQTNTNFVAEAKYATFTIEKADPELSFSSSTATITIGQEDEFVKPTLTTTPAGLEVTYESANPDVATVNKTTGDITPVAVGENIEISATFAGDDNYNSGSTSYLLMVSKAFNFVAFADGQSYATYCNSDEDDLTLPNGITAYAVQIPSSGNEVILKSIGFIPGTVDSSQPIYTPVLLMREDASNSSFGTVTKYVRQSGDEIPVNHLKFTTADKTTDGSQFILYNNEFVKAKGTISGPACYLENTTGNPARYFTIGDDDATAIDNVQLTIDDEAGAQWYDLLGRKIQKPTKAGLYIMNGKKKVVNNK